MARLRDREFLILMAEAPLPDDPGMVVPVSFKVVHELRADEERAEAADLVAGSSDAVRFEGRKVLYSWIGGTRRDWRGQGHFRALTEESEAWAIAHGFHEVVVKTKNRFYDMRGTLDQLEFDVVKYEPNAGQPRVEGVSEQAAHVGRPPRRTRACAPSSTRTDRESADARPRPSFPAHSQHDLADVLARFHQRGARRRPRPAETCDRRPASRRRCSSSGHTSRRSAAAICALLLAPSAAAASSR